MAGPLEIDAFSINKVRARLQPTVLGRAWEDWATNYRHRTPDHTGVASRRPDRADQRRHAVAAARAFCWSQRGAAGNEREN